MRTKISHIDRRGLMRAAAWSGLTAFGLAPAVGLAAGPEAKLDAREGKTVGLTKAEAARFKPLAKGVMAESFAVVLANGERHLFRVSGGEKGAASVESIGPKGATHSTSIMEGDSPAPYIERTQAQAATAAAMACGGFWDCFFPCMIGKITQGVWNNIKTKWQSCWNTAMKKRFWYQKVAAFLSCIFSLPYGAYAVACFFQCR
jgi:hypothetical protein